MPFIPFQSNLPGTAIGLWHIAEDEQFFLDRLTLYENEQKRLSRISHPQKRLEWLSSRLCLKELLSIDYQVESLNQFSGKPYLTDNSHYISYTHTTDFAAAIASSTSEVAIDLESRKRKRTYETRRLFMNSWEKAYFEQEEDEILFLLMWSAKETLFKIFGQKGVSLRKHIRLELENFQLESNGCFTGIVHKDDLEKRYELHYAIFPEFVLTYTDDGMSEHEFREEELYGCA